MHMVQELLLWISATWLQKMYGRDAVKVPSESERTAVRRRQERNLTVKNDSLDQVHANTDKSEKKKCIILSPFRGISIHIKLSFVLSKKTRFWKDKI